MAKRTNRVIVIGAGPSELATALHLTAVGREVTVLERHSAPGARHGILEIDGFRFDVGPHLPLAPETLAAPLHAVGEQVHDWIDILRLDPICRIHYPDGTTLDLDKPGLPAPDPDRRLSHARSRLGFSPADHGWYPRGGTNAIPRTLASVAEKHGVCIRYQLEPRDWEEQNGRIVAVHTDDGERLTADGVVLPPAPSRQRTSWVVIHLGSSAHYTKIAHHNIHFGDPPILVSSPSLTDPTAAPPGHHVYQVVAPIDTDGPPARRYAGEIVATLEARGYLDLGASLRLSYVATTSDGAAGMPTKRTGRLHPTFANVVIAGSGLESGSHTAALVDATAAKT